MRIYSLSALHDSSARPQTAFLNSLTATDLPGSWLLALGFLAPGSWLLASWLLASWLLAPGFLAPGFLAPGSWPGGLPRHLDDQFLFEKHVVFIKSSINLLTLRGVFDGHFSKVLSFFSGGTPRNLCDIRATEPNLLPYRM